MSGFADDISRLIPHLRRFARALVRGHSAQLADDLVQETLVVAMRAEKLARGSDLPAWCYSTLMRLNRHRGASASPEARTGSALSFLPKEIARLDLLPLDEREVLLMAVLAGFTYPRIAATLHVTLDTVMIRLDHARHRLARAGQSPAPHPAGSRTAIGDRNPAGSLAAAGSAKPGRTPNYLHLVK